MKLYSLQNLLQFGYEEDLSCHSLCANGVRCEGLVLLYRIIKETKVVNSGVFRCPCSAALSYVSILCLAEVDLLCFASISAAQGTKQNIPVILSYHTRCSLLSGKPSDETQTITNEAGERLGS